MAGLEGSDRLTVLRGCPGLPGDAGPEGETGVDGDRGTCPGSGGVTEPPPPVRPWGGHVPCSSLAGARGPGPCSEAASDTDPKARRAPRFPYEGSGLRSVLGAHIWGTVDPGAHALSCARLLIRGLSLDAVSAVKAFSLPHGSRAAVSPLRLPVR